jgi:hypothetical protein
MILSKFRKDKEKTQRFAHLFGGVIILINGYDKYESGNNHYLIFMIAGFVFLLVALFHSQIIKKFPWVSAVFFLIESLLSFVIAYEYFAAGKVALPFCYLFIGIMQIFIPVIKSKKSADKK